MSNNKQPNCRIISLMMVLLLFAGSSWVDAQSFEMEPITEMKTTPIYVNGRQVAPNQWFSYKLEGIFRLEGYGLQKGSSVSLTARKGTKLVYDKQFKVNAYGAFKSTVIIPDVKRSVRCVARYIRETGEERELVFFFKAFQRR